MLRGLCNSCLSIVDSTGLSFAHVISAVSARIVMRTLLRFLHVPDAGARIPLSARPCSADRHGLRLGLDLRRRQECSGRRLSPALQPDPHDAGLRLPGAVLPPPLRPHEPQIPPRRRSRGFLPGHGLPVSDRGATPHDPIEVSLHHRHGRGPGPHALPNPRSAPAHLAHSPLECLGGSAGRLYRHHFADHAARLPLRLSCHRHGRPAHLRMRCGLFPARAGAGAPFAPCALRTARRSPGRLLRGLHGRQHAAARASLDSLVPSPDPRSSHHRRAGHRGGLHCSILGAEIPSCYTHGSHPHAWTGLCLANLVRLPRGTARPPRRGGCSLDPRGYRAYWICPRRRATYLSRRRPTHIGRATSPVCNPDAPTCV